MRFLINIFRDSYVSRGKAILDLFVNYDISIESNTNKTINNIIEIQ
jgi:hypothetical protein